MLESTVKQLAGADRESKLDAYMMLVRALKASNNLPDRIALQDQMGLFMQFIQRDVTTKNVTGTIDSSLANHALTLLVTFLYYPAIASTLSYDFGVFIIDYCIRCFEDNSIPKDVIRHSMQVVASQDFSPKVMTADRIGRLVAALHKLEEHMKGKSIIMSRIIIYRRLVKQSKVHMASHTDWLLDLFADMLSGMKEIRTAAVALGFEAIFTIGKEKQLSRRVMEILQLTVDDIKYIEYYVQKLLTMAGNKQESAVVPQIWSVIILLLRCPVEKWEFFSPWLEIIQKCFNSGDPHTKLEANYAWNRLVYAFYLNESSFSKTIGTVCQPFLSQLKRKVSGKFQEEFRRVVFGSICNLYYYAFKPNSTSAQVDHYWVACVRPIMQKLTTTESETKQNEKSTFSPSDNLVQATIILTGLFDSSTPRVWKEDRIAENPLVKPDELPAVDPKWIRKNADKVFAVVDPIISKSFLDMASLGSPTHKLWHTLISTVAAAASKEVKAMVRWA
ncbi:putative telomere length regulator protein [Eutypa lata UCREL1]|uniref:Putative telomere length regulator protein n=1 Tax=Eutypa lata (strain UCR-EL1) TaxID=1287681 RepID=M7TPZ6_EUTLA|nr:putative telomere length regulator protein [Eutypa lata UCREL1]